MQAKVGITLAVLCLFCLQAASAQDGNGLSPMAYNPPEDYVPSNPFAMRDIELGANIAPVLVELAGGHNDQPRYSFTYQMVNNKSGLRIGMGWTNFDPVHTTTLFVADTNTVVREERNTAEDVFDLRIGYARYKQFNMVRLEYGADFILGNKHVNENTEYLEYHQNTTLGQYDFVPELQDPVLSRKYNLYGISPFVGVTTMFGDKWAINVHTAPTIVYNKMISPVTLRERNFWEVKYNFLNTVNLIYRF